ncbi:MAG: acyl-CoA dehydratase activase-related protein [Puniceicoccales bacterium]|jgi:predicted CoA-substrate-specific enzyme activase|nr:acyl-CoA dehydratase activase-related protein [Puniceicoccales bacterium]
MPHALTEPATLNAGLDAGSTTLKFVVTDAVDGAVRFSAYRRHHADIAGTLRQLLADAAGVVGNETPLGVAITGSAGLGLAEAFGLPFMQESIAAAAMARHYHPLTRTLVDVGGEDAKMIFFAPGHAPDIRMNGSCAGGTGAFIDQIATLLGCEAAALNTLALASRSLHPVASRCGVFAKTDIQNLLSRNVSPADIAASAFNAVAQQIVSSLARGRDIEAPVLFCGGPLAHLGRLREACAAAMGVGADDCVLPENAALAPALGCAIAPEQARRAVSLASLREWAEQRGGRERPAAKKTSPCTACLAGEKAAANADADVAVVADGKVAAGAASVATLPALFKDADDYAAWRTRKELCQLPKAEFSQLDGAGECWLGVDSGSTTTKVVALAHDGGVLFTYYAPNNGNPLEAVRHGLVLLCEAATTAGKPALRVRRAAVTGYGEDLLKAAFGFDTGLVETMAHYQAARSLSPKVSFLLDIGGQDMKAVFVENDAIVRLDINEACSSGCGSFIDTFARSLGMSAAEFAALACAAEYPSDLGTRCTVFMNSKVKQAQRENATRADIAAGLAYSVAKNCLYKVLKLRNPAELGGSVVAQGGTMRNHAVVRAFELLTGLDITVAPMPELMGAYGAARHALHEDVAADASRLLSALAEAQTHETADTVCPGCENKCLVRKHTFANGNTFYAGNKCEKIFSNRGGVATKGVNFHTFKQQLLFARARHDAAHRDDAAAVPAAPAAAVVTIGIPRVLNFYENFPFWHALLTACGMRVALSAQSTFKLYAKGVRSIMSDNICFPAKLVHGHVLDLVDKKVDRILMPFVLHEQNGGAPGECGGGNGGSGGGAVRGYNCPIVSGYSDVIRSALDTAGRHNIPLDAPTLTFADTVLLRKACRRYLCETLGVAPRVAAAAIERAIAAQREFGEALSAKIHEIVAAAANGARPLIILAGRPYHTDPLIQHKVAEMFAEFGADVVNEDIARDLADTKTSPWAYPNRILAAATWVATAPAHVHFVQITSFGCGPDAFIVDEVGERLRRAGKSHTVLKVDDINNPGSLRLRARSLIESLGARSVATGVVKPVLSVAPFTDADRRRTILVPFFSEIYSPFIPVFMRLMGYKALALPPANADSIDAGLQYANNEICYPATLVIGDFVCALKSGKYKRDEIALGITQTGGQCRATSYLALIKRALVAAGFADVPVVAVGTVAGAVANEQPGFRISWRGNIRILIEGMLYADHIGQMYNAAAPREKRTGEAARLRDSYIEAGTACLARREVAGFRQLLRRAVADFNAAAAERDVPVVGIVGEIFIKYNSVGNRNAVEWLISQGIEPVVPPLADFFLQEIPNRQFNRRNALSRRSWTDIIDKIAYRIIRHWQNVYGDIASGFRYFRRGEDVFTKAKTAEKVVTLAAQYGEGWLIPAELAVFAESGIENAVSLQPFGCIANHLVAKGIERRIRQLYPQMNLLFLDLDSGTSEANLLNRMHFIVQNAKDALARNQARQA